MMYYDELQDQVESEQDVESESDVDIDNMSVASDATPLRLSRQQAAKVAKLADPGYNVVRRQNGSKIEMYSTRSNPGYLIRDPVHGTRYNDKVGSNDEHAYFKVRMTSIGHGVDPITLYYSSPEAYEVHQRCRVSSLDKKAWLDKKKRHGF